MPGYAWKALLSLPSSLPAARRKSRVRRSLLPTGSTRGRAAEGAGDGGGAGPSLAVVGEGPPSSLTTTTSSHSLQVRHHGPSITQSQWEAGPGSPHSDKRTVTRDSGSFLVHGAFGGFLSPSNSVLETRGGKGLASLGLCNSLWDAVSLQVGAQHGLAWLKRQGARSPRSWGCWGVQSRTAVTLTLKLGSF